MREFLEIPIDLLDGFPSFPFRLKRDSDFLNLLESISIYGILEPDIVRPYADRFQIVSGHRRKWACEILRYDRIPCIIIDDIDDSEAILLMLDLNLRQRNNLLPSEKAFAYKLKADAYRSEDEGQPD